MSPPLPPDFDHDAFEPLDREASRRLESTWRALAWLLFFALALIGVAMIDSLAHRARAETIDGNRIIVIDGDTIALPCATPTRGCSERLRILNIDAPETRSPVCDAERIAGLAARERLMIILRGRPVLITRCGEPGHDDRCTDRYGRTLARLATAEGDIGQRLISSGHALPWEPGAKAKFERQQHWCGR